MAQFSPISRGIFMGPQPRMLPYEYWPKSQPVCTPMHSAVQPKMETRANPFRKGVKFDSFSDKKTIKAENSKFRGVISLKRGRVVGRINPKRPTQKTATVQKRGLNRNRVVFMMRKEFDCTQFWPKASKGGSRLRDVRCRR